MFSVAATISIGVRPTVNVRNAGKVRCRAAASAPRASASIRSMTGMRSAGAVDNLGVSRHAAGFHQTVARQTLAGGRVGKKFVVKAMFEVRVKMLLRVFWLMTRRGGGRRLCLAVRVEFRVSVSRTRASSFPRLAIHHESLA